jgi:hypothetical protein
MRPRQNGQSPWGQIQYVDQLEHGAASVGTAGHGGLWLPKELAKKIRDKRPALTECYSEGNGTWWEEDLAWRVVHECCPSVFASKEGLGTAQESAVQLARYRPDECEEDGLAGIPTIRERLDWLHDAIVGNPRPDVAGRFSSCEAGRWSGHMVGLSPQTAATAVLIHDSAWVSCFWDGASLHTRSVRRTFATPRFADRALGTIGHAIESPAVLRRLCGMIDAFETARLARLARTA